MPRPLTNPFLGPGHLLRHRSRFRALLRWDWRKTKVVPSGTPPTLQFPVSGFSPSLGSWGDGACPVTSLWSMGGHRAEDLSRLGAVHPLVAISGCVGGTSFSWGVSQAPLLSETLRARERICPGKGCEVVEAADLPPSGPSSPWGICEDGS